MTDRLWASLMFFTRLPLGRLASPDAGGGAAKHKQARLCSRLAPDLASPDAGGGAEKHKQDRLCSRLAPDLASPDAGGGAEKHKQARLCSRLAPHFRQPDAESFRHVVDYWPLVGWLTGGAVALTFWLASAFLPAATAAWIAVGTRLLLTGALHEDGLADFCDGFGGGTTRERTLAIMKDSHVGTYGVLGLLFLVGLQTGLISALPPHAAPAVIFTADVYAKACGSFVILQLPYARTAEQAKSGVVYSAWKGRAAAGHVLRCLLALAPGAAWLMSLQDAFLFFAFLAPPATELLLVAWMRRRLQGYTGDCCGAVFLLCELSFHLSAVTLYHIII